MTRITKQRASAEIGIGACLAEFALAGWVGEVVQSDFGEDLAFQIAHRGRADPFRIYCQVKTFAARPKKVSLSVGHLRKWLLHIEPVLLVVHDRAEKALYAAPLHELFDFYVLPASVTTVSVEVARLARVTSDELNAIAWRSRARVFDFIARERSQKVIDYSRHMEFSGLAEREDTRVALQVSELWALRWFLDYMDIVEERQGKLYRSKSGLMEKIARAIEKRLAGKSAGLRKVGLREGLSVRELCCLMLLAEWGELTDQGLPGFLLERCSMWMEFLLVSDFSQRGIDQEKLFRMKIL